MRLIDADLLKANIDNWYALVNEWGQTRMTLSHNDIIAKIDNMPTADVLDKIRAEIQEDIESFSMSDWETNNILADGLQMALNIIDGYREGEIK